MRQGPAFAAIREDVQCTHLECTQQHWFRRIRDSAEFHSRYRKVEGLCGDRCLRPSAIFFEITCGFQASPFASALAGSARRSLCCESVCIFDLPCSRQLSMSFATVQ